MKITCPNPSCGRHLSGPKALMGRRFPCPTCGHSFIWTDCFHSGDSFVIYDRSRRPASIRIPTNSSRSPQSAAHGVEITTVTADLGGYDIAPGAWAGIIATFWHLPPAVRRRIHRSVVAGLMPGGVFILEAYTPAQLAFDTGGPKAPELLMTLAGLREELSGLEFQIARELERDVIEGTGHTGRGAVVQVLARRPLVANNLFSSNNR